MSSAQPTEETPALALPDGASHIDRTPEAYGPLKALCEDVVLGSFGNRALIVRPGLIVGPYDPTDRFTYWPVRIARGGAVLAPIGPEYFVQFIDARDLADWILLQVEQGTGGTFNVTGPAHTITMGDVLLTSATVANTSPDIRWADESFLKANAIGEWMDLPLWISTESNLPGMRNVQIMRAVRTGLHIRPLRETVRDTYRWASTRPATYEWNAGLTSERETEAIARLG